MAPTQLATILTIVRTVYYSRAAATTLHPTLYTLQIPALIFTEKCFVYFKLVVYNGV